MLKATIIMLTKDGKEHKVTIFNDALQRMVALANDIAGDDNNIDDLLLKLPEIQFTITYKGTLSSFTVC